MAFHLMIVDDSSAMRAFIVRVIWLSGLDVALCMQASNGKEALELLRANWIDIVLTDINMPVMNGEEFVRCMEADARTLATNFMGADDGKGLLPAQVAGVIGELTNMICGAVLSELESNATFDLGEPEWIHVRDGDPGPDITAGSPSICRFEFSE